MITLSNKCLGLGHPSSKRCTKCNHLLKLDFYFRDKYSSDGHYSACKKCHSKSVHKWAIGHRKKFREYAQAWRDRNPEEYRATSKRYNETHPWARFWRNINSRLNYKENSSYKRYRALGIKNLLRVCDLKFLWFRDKAFLMRRPSIDRKDSLGHYTRANCQFLELSENVKKKWREYHARQAKK